jgi:outer membrane receptor protein involved in Fe transport
VEWSRRAGNLKLAATVEASDRNADDMAPGGYGPLVREYVSGLVDAGQYFTTSRNKLLIANGSAEYRSGPSRYRGNIGVEYRGNDRDEGALVAVPEYFLSQEDVWKVEAGANLERALNPWLVARVDALQTMQQAKKTAGRVGRLNPSSATAGESILRGSLGVRRWENLSLEFAAEGAFNFLEQESALGFANSNVRVEERRFQPSVTMNWHIFEPLALEFGARREVSTIRQSGDTNSEHMFSFFKPRAIGVLDLWEGTQLRARVEREVSQLVFADFAANAGNQDGQAVAGNSEREPERAWTYEAAIEQRLWARSVLVLTATHQEVEQIVDNIPIGLNSEGNGNIGDGVRDTYALDLKVALDPLGIRGGRLELLPKYVISEATDPFSGERRNISGTQQWSGRINLYLERPEWKSTFALEGMIGFLFRDYKRDQVTHSVQPIYVTAWWERTFRPGTSLRASIFNVGGRERTRRRDVYLGARPNAPLSFYEDRLVKRGAAFQLTLRRTY